MNKSKLKKLVIKGLSIREIACSVGSSYTNTNYWLKKFKLTTRKSSRYACHCGEKNPSNFYGHKRSLCAACMNALAVKRSQQVRLRIIQHLGGACSYCGYMKFSCALDVHHLDSAKKDPQFHAARFWQWPRIEKELKNCILLCKNCHAATHAKLIFPSSEKNEVEVKQ